MKRALGITVHTGWGACVVVAGSPEKPQILANQRVELLDDSKRFCFHMAAEMDRPYARKWLAGVRKEALANARRGLAPLLRDGVAASAIVAKANDPGDLDEILGAHPRIHTAEGCFYRDVFREACGERVRIVPPSSLDPAQVGKLAGPPWGKDQRLAALAAWKAMR